MTFKQPLLINLSLPKCGSSSINDYCKNMNSRHEAWHSGVTETYLKVLNNNYPKETFLKYLLFRQIALELDIDAATFHHFYAEDIINLFPDSSYIYIYRDPLSWILSMLNMWAYFNDYHFLVLQYGNEREKIKNKKWINWINSYAKIYSKSLNTFKVKNYSNQCQDLGLEFLTNDLLDFWSKTSKEIIKIKRKDGKKLNIFNLCRDSEIKSFIDNLLNNKNINDIQKFPKSNAMKVINRKKNKPYFIKSQINKFISQDKFDKNNKILKELNFLRI